MERFCKVITVVVFLASGIPGSVELLRADDASRCAGILYLVCFGLSLLGTFALFKQRALLARGLLLWAIGLPSLVYVTRELTIAFPTFFRAPISLTSEYSDGQFFHFGIDLIPGCLFLAVWFALRSLARSQVPSELRAAEAETPDPVTGDP